MNIYHTHHIVPKHAGGSDDPSNLVKLTVEEHAQAHLDLYEKYGDERDLVASRMLKGQITKAEAIKIVQKLPKTKKWKKQMSERMSGENNPMYGKEVTKEHREKLSASGLGKKKPGTAKAMKKLQDRGESYAFSKKDREKAVNARIKKQLKWYTNGIDNKYIGNDGVVPDGYRRGRTQKRKAN